MGDQMMSDFSIYHTSDVILGHIPFRLRFMDLHGVACSTHLRDTHWGDDLFIILSWSSSGASLEPSSQTHTFRHLDVIMIFLLGYAFLTCGSDSVMDVDDQDHTFDDGWFDVIWFSDLPHIWCHTGAYFHFGWDLWISIDLHDRPHLRHTRWVDDLFSFYDDSLVKSLLESFSQPHTLWYCLDFVMELSQTPTLPYHHFSGVHVRSFIHPFGVILELSGQTKCTSCYIRACFPLLVVKMIVFSQIYYDFHYSAEGCLLTLVCHYFSDFWSRWASRGARPSGFWLPRYPWLSSRLLCWGRGSYPDRLFPYDSQMDHSFETTMDSSNRAYRVRDIWPIVTHHRVLWFSPMGCKAIFIVGLTVPTHQRSIFWDSWGFFQTVPMDWEL